MHFDFSIQQQKIKKRINISQMSGDINKMGLNSEKHD